MSTTAPGRAPAAELRLNLKRITLVGLPNSGKTSLSNALTGGYGLVSNYPQTTVEPARRSCAVDGQHWTVTDTPGLHGLFVQAEEELAVRDLLFAEPPDVLVQCVDAHRLRESLLLTADLLDLGVPLVLVVTAVGESARRGLRIDGAALSRKLGVPVVVSPRPGAGLAELRRALLDPPPAPRPVPFAPDLEQALARVQDLVPAEAPHRRLSALLLLEQDPSFAARVPADGLRAARAALAGRAPHLVSGQRNQWVDAVAAAVTRRFPADGSKRLADTFARLSRHPLGGLPILAFFLGLIYVLVVYVAGNLSLLLTTAVTDPVVAWVTRLLPAGLWRDLFVGPRGLLTLGLFNSLTTVLPILAVFFLVFGMLEDIGYLPNVAILTRRVSAKLGITGNAVIPLVLGLGCKTMATMTARTLTSRKEKLIVIALIGFAIPCSAQTGLSIAILGQHGPLAFLGAFGFLLVIEAAAGLLLNRLLPDDGPSDFIQELPPLRLPRPGAVARKTGYRLLWFLKEAIPIFVAAALVLFVLDATGALTVIKHALQPFMTRFLGLPVDMVDALLLTLARSEAAAGYVLAMAHAGTLGPAQSIVAVILLTTFAQCFANIGAMFREVGPRAAAAIVASIYVASFVVSGVVHALLLALAKVVPL
jgi:ferrous iron transport protein B